MSADRLLLSYMDMSKVDADWQQCAVWLCECSLLPSDHPALSDGGTAIDLLHTLMDGVMLCHLLAVLSDGQADPKTMSDFTPRTQQSQFLRSNNIRLFLRLCKENFGISESDLFEVEDLDQAKNFGNVVLLLSKLSKSPLAQKHGVRGFPAENEVIVTSHEYYNHLEDLADDLAKTKLEDESGYNTMTDEEGDSKIYDVIVYSGVPKSSAAEPLSKRQHCINEIVSTEKNYVDVLKMLIESYKKPLAKILTQQEIDTIFIYLEDLHTIHRNINSDLQLAVSDTSRFLSISEAFLKNKESLLIYGKYCGHMNASQSLVLEILKQDPKKKEKIELCQSRSGNHSKFQLVDVLKIPMQRVLKYHLLLDSLYKFTTEDHPEKPGIAFARDSMRDLAQSINEVKRDIETMNAIDQIQASITSLALPSDRKLRDYGRAHMDGELKVAVEGVVRQKHRHVFLFDKLMILCKSKGGTFLYKKALNMMHAAVETTNGQTKKGEKWNYNFTFQTGKDIIEKCVFSAKTDELRKAWISAINLAIENNTPPGARDNGYCFEMTCFHEPTYCCVCNALMRGCFFQGYKCTRSHLTAHKDCIKSAPQFSTGGPPVTPVRRSQIVSMGSLQMPYPNSPSNSSCSGNSVFNSPNYMSKVRAKQVYSGVPSPGAGRKTLTFAAHDVIDLVNRDDPTWWEGKCQGKDGWFPASMVVEMRGRIDSGRQGPTSYLSTHASSLDGSYSSHVQTDERSPHLLNRYSMPVHSMSLSVDNFNEHPWYAGALDRDEASTLLQGHPNGTYMVRVSKSSTRKGEYSLSVVHGNPKHIRIQRTEEQFYLAEGQYFTSIPALIDHYKLQPLSSYFANLNTTLITPFKYSTRSRPSSMTNSGDANVLFCATACYDFSGDTEKQLSFRKGEQISILKASDVNWWTGRINGKIGFIPATYVTKDPN